MAKYIVETYYNCSFKVTHYLDEVNENQLSNLEKRDDGKFEIISVKLDNRKTKSLDKGEKFNKNQKEIKQTNLKSDNPTVKNLINDTNQKFEKKIH